MAVGHSDRLALTRHEGSLAWLYCEQLVIHDPHLKQNNQIKYDDDDPQHSDGAINLFQTKAPAPPIVMDYTFARKDGF